jgi:NAD(P)-dependent dehydrogenase (short-subunit alcohol dehydrogenase family)
MGGSIINLSSKSGLDASKNHSAYNATKAGEIHLARGWAQELAEHGIRVNTVCPGNVFRESSIWNEDYIEALAEKRGLEPEEVIPYYINMTALKEEIDWDDIADAVAFLSGPHSSKITGQTLVVDAGQVFVR